jgi:hypothetical protein
MGSPGKHGQHDRASAASAGLFNKVSSNDHRGVGSDQHLVRIEVAVQGFGFLHARGVRPPRGCGMPTGGVSSTSVLVISTGMSRPASSCLRRGEADARINRQGSFME